MKLTQVLCGLVFLVFAELNLSAANDPVKMFLGKNPPDIREANKYYSDDRLLRLDFDLNNDGQVETLLSMARDRDGKQGNIWTVYQKSADSWIELGMMTFSPSRFYLGNIDAINRYGLVTFGPSGAGEGALRAYFLNGSTIEEMQIGAVTRDQQTGRLSGDAVFNTYFGRNATAGDDVVTVIGADQLTQRYGIAIQPLTYREAVQSLLTAQSTPVVRLAAAQTPSGQHSTPAPTAARLSSASSVAPLEAMPTALAPALLVEHKTPVWPWLIGIAALIVIVSFALKRRS